MRNARSPLGSVVTVLLLVSGPAIAEPPDTELAALGDEAILFEAIPSVYGASKYEQKTTEAPSAVSIVTGEEIRQYGHRTLAEVLASTQGIFSSYDRNYTYLGVRGFARPGDYNSRVLLLVDGHRLNDPVYDAALVGTEFPVDVGLIDRVEVIRGPSSSLYGTSAFFGVVNVITRRGRDLDTAELSTEVGSRASYQPRMTYGKRLSEHADLLGSASYYQSDGERRLHYSEFDDPATNDGVAVNADGDEARRYFGSASYRGFALQSGYGSRDKHIPTAAFETVFDTDRTYTTDELTWVDLSWRGEAGPGWDLLSRVYYDRYEYRGDYLYDYSTTGVPELVVNQDDTVGERWGTELNASRTFFEDHKLTLGGEFRDNFRLDQMNFDRRPAFTYLDDKRGARDFGLYLQDDHAILENLLVSAGVRYDHYDTFGGNLSPRLALIYDPLARTTVKLVYGEAFRAPSAYELYYGGSTQKASPDLEPELNQTLELVLEQGLGEHFRAGASLYRYEIDDLIDVAYDPADDLYFYDNVSHVSAQGVELRLDAHWASGFAGGLSYALQRAEDDEGDRLSNSPKHMAKLQVTFPLWPERLSGGVELHYLSDRETLGGDTVDGVVLTNLTLLHRELLDGFTVSGTVKNLFDVEYGDPAGEEHLQREIEQDGRSFWLKLDYRF
jgi:iron complex outermembrane receptor protein